MKITRLKDHGVLRAASAVCREYLVKCNPDEPEQDPLKTRRESYAIETLVSLGSVMSCVDQLHFSVDMLSGYRSSSTPGEMNRYDYIVFGIENYYLRLTSIFDRCLILANVVYQLGLPERQCNNDSIINNSYIRESAVAKALKGIDKFTMPFRSHRNTIAHHATYSEKDLDQLGSYYVLLEEDEGFERYQYFCKRLTDDLVTEKKVKFKGDVSKIEYLTEAYLDALYPAFATRLKAYA